MTTPAECGQEGFRTARCLVDEFDGEGCHGFREHRPAGSAQRLVCGRHELEHRAPVHRSLVDQLDQPEPAVGGGVLPLGVETSGLRTRLDRMANARATGAGVASELAFLVNLGLVLDLKIIWNVVDQPALLLVLGVTAVLARPLGRLLSRGVLGVVFVAILGATLAATTTTGSPYYSLSGIKVYLDQFAHPARLFQGLAGSDERLANIGLFLPLGVAATLLWRRPITVVVASAALSFTIEAWQGFIGRGGDPVDVVHNTAGALLGAVLGWSLTIRRSVRSRPAADDQL